MATNAASHNPAGVKTNPASAQPPPQPSPDTISAISKAAASDPLRQHVGDVLGGDSASGTNVKSEKELERERKKAEKLKKFSEKKAKPSSDAIASKTKDKSAKKESAKDTPLPEYIEETPPGEKKILKPLDDQFHKAYVPGVVESAWYSWWEKEGFLKPHFAADGKVKTPGYFAIPIPPPNVTGALHMGHAMTVALQDTMIRWNRMLGKTTLWLPGCDHAGIATQNVVENMLWNRQKKTRHDLGRQEFVKLTWKWKEEYHTKINNACRRLGSSVDWSREAFTMDENLSRAVTETFVRLHEEGLIYRANRLVNWCTKLNTAISNLEVDNKDLEGRTLLDIPGYERKVEFGVLTHFKYPIDGSDETIEVATTRPETMLGDSGVAVNAKDDRYKHLIGRNARHPFVDRLLPIFADDYVDMEFGTGAVKITPAHDPNDFALGQRNDLAVINILNDDGTLNHNAGSFEKMKRFDARYEVIAKLKEKGLYVKWEPNPMKVPICNRSKDVIEPLLKPQWWMRMESLAEAAAEVVRNGEIKIRPDSAEKSYLRWLENVNDWCLSRQLWWGHQAPAYFVNVEGEPGENDDNERWVTGRTFEEAEEKAKAKFAGKKISLTRDEDVLDTWFSSGLWPFSTLGWPKQTSDFENFYPTSILETGWDILFFWVARMVMLGLKLTGKVPFYEVYCHSLIRDSEGRKMSKSLGNVIDPLDVMKGIQLQELHDKLLVGNLDPKELKTATTYQKTSFPDGIPECGADALRFSLVSYTTGGGDISFDIKVIHGYRRFCNKIYQATKYVLGKLDNDFVPLATSEKTGKESLAERWILHKLTVAAKEINAALAEREFQNATTTAYQFWYNHFCDVYIENSKLLISDGTPEEQLSAKNTLYTALEGGLTMIHPFMPFLTEELWQRLPRRPNDKTPSIMIAAYPVYNASLDDPASETAYELVLSVSKAIRSIVSEYAVKENAALTIQLFDQTSYETCTQQLPSIRSLVGKSVSDLSLLSASDPKPSGCVPAPVSSSATVFLTVKGHVDIDAEVEKAQRKLERARELLKKHKDILDAEGYHKNVSEEVFEAQRQKVRNAEAEVREMEASVRGFEGLKLE